MKYSIFIHPATENLSSTRHAVGFIHAILRKRHQINRVFFYGHAVKCAFEHDDDWLKISQHNIELMACSSIAEQYLIDGYEPLEHFKIGGLGQWMDAHLSADKRIEFV